MQKSAWKWLVLCLAALGFSSTASAGPVLWTLQNVTFADGGIAFGNFTYDVDTNTYSDVNIQTTAGAVRGPSLYLFVGPLPPPDPFEVPVMASGAANLTGTNSLTMFFFFLSNDGGLRSLSGIEATCEAPSCGLTQPDTRREIVTGEILGVEAHSVPEPAVIWTFALGLAGVAVMRVRRN